MIESLITGAALLMPEGHLVANDLFIAGSRITGVGQREGNEALDTVDLAGYIVAPGYVDLQVNGGGGVLFNSTPSLHGLEVIAATHLAAGTTSFLPTLISDQRHIIEQAMTAVQDAMDKGIPGILGIHIEGPFLNTEKRGIHSAQNIQRLDRSYIELLCSLSSGVCLVTLAPEMVEVDQIEELVSRGVIVSLGHSNATYSATTAALEAGATGFTHLYNAMSPLTSREPGMTGAALLSTDAWVSMILDGHHISEPSAELVFRARGTDRCVLISDAMPPVGSDIDNFLLHGQRIFLDGCRCADEHGRLAGSAISLSTAVELAVKQFGRTKATALRMASLYPAQFLGRSSQIGNIRTGSQADLVCLDEYLNVSGVMKAGRWIVDPRETRKGKVS